MWIKIIFLLYYNLSVCKRKQNMEKNFRKSMGLNRRVRLKTDIKCVIVKQENVDGGAP